ncbi:hypothetical protein SK128_005537, partial [Halocaridina rubra]
MRMTQVGRWGRNVAALYPKGAKWNERTKVCPQVNCSLSTVTLSSHMFRCHSGGTIPRRWVCDGEADCADNSDEKDCAETSNAAKEVVPNRARICRENEFQCGSYCVLRAWVCDGTEDCLHGEDEASCPDCPSDRFQCKNKKQCILNHQRCDAKNDCADGSDEDNCSVPQSPEATSSCDLTTHYLCGGGKCIEQRYLCDGSNNCENGEDESEKVCGINECERNNGGCTHICMNTREGYHCACDAGYRLIGKYTCEDINECKEIPGICSQTCTNTNGGYHCSCLPGYLRDTRNFTRCKAENGDALLLFAHMYDIRSLRLTDREMTSVVSATSGATALDYMFRSQHIIWSDHKENEIVRASLANPEAREVLVKGEKITSDGLAVDWIHNNLYYSDRGNFQIHMMTWNAKWSKIIVSEKLGRPRAIAVSPLNGYIFWSDWGQDAKIERAWLDGYNRTPIVETPHVYWPNGITIDHPNNHIYWCDGKLNTISRANLDGSQLEVILFSTSVLRLPYSITVFEDRLYWTDWFHMAMYSANKFTGEGIKNISAGHLIDVPKSIHVYHEYRQPSGENVCATQQCSHICVRSPTGSPLCVCPDGLMLSSKDSSTCLDNDSEETLGFKSTQVQDERSRVPNLPFENPQRNDYLSKLHDPQGLTADEPHIGMIIGVTAGSAVMVLLLVLVSIAVWKSRQGDIKSIRFHNPIYRKTEDDMEEGIIAITKKDLLYNPAQFKYSQGPQICDN